MSRITLSALMTALLVAVTATSTTAGGIKGKVTIPRAKDLSNCVVYVEHVDGDFAPPKEPVLMNQKDLTFVPHVLPVLKGTTVRFRNSDDVLHNVFTPDKCAHKFNLGTWPKGETKDYVFDEAGCIAALLCNVHPEMEAYVLVLQNPYFAVTEKPGLFAIPDVPAGTYKVVAWNEDREPVTQEVKVAKEGDTEVEFDLAKKGK
jgi:plastocyanin